MENLNYTTAYFIFLIVYASYPILFFIGIAIYELYQKLSWLLYCKFSKPMPKADIYKALAEDLKRSEKSVADTKNNSVPQEGDNQTCGKEQCKDFIQCD